MCFVWPYLGQFTEKYWLNKDYVIGLKLTTDATIIAINTNTYLLVISAKLTIDNNYIVRGDKAEKCALCFNKLFSYYKI